MSYPDYDSNTQRNPLGMGAPPYVGAQIDEGLRAYMQRVYSYMAGGLASSLTPPLRPVFTNRSPARHYSGSSCWRRSASSSP